MLQDIEAQHYSDLEDNPAGGWTEALGLQIRWQEGPLRVDGELLEPNGCFVETVIDAAMDRIKYYQESKFACHPNEVALAHLEAALEALQSRTRDREARGVEGTHQQ